MATDETEDESPPSWADLWRLAKQLASKLKDWAPVSAALLLILAAPLSVYTQKFELVFIVTVILAAMLFVLRGWQMYLEVGLASRKLDADLQTKLARVQANFKLKAMKKQATAGKGQTPKVPKPKPPAVTLPPPASKGRQP